MSQMLTEIESRMMKSIETLKGEFSRLRTNRAHPSLLEHIRVSCYGTETPLNQVASVAVENNRTLTVTPWDKTMVGPIEKAIMTSDLGLNPVSAGLVIRVPLPALTEQRRKELVKVVRDIAEQGRVAIRNVRRDANQQNKELVKDKKISEDEERRNETNIQKMTDKYIAEVDKLLAGKEAEIMAI
jgi:ribosome recycling factor